MFLKSGTYLKIWNISKIYLTVFSPWGGLHIGYLDDKWLIAGKTEPYISKDWWNENWFEFYCRKHNIMKKFSVQSYWQWLKGNTEYIVHLTLHTVSVADLMM